MTTLDSQGGSAIAPGAAGGFTVAWGGRGPGDAHGVFARRFDALGVPLGDEITIPTSIANDQGWLAIAPDSSGGFTIAWQSYEQDGSFDGVYARRFDAAGAWLGGEIPVNATTASWQNEPAIAPDSSDGFTVAWQSDGQDGSSYGVYARRFDSAGAPLSGEIPVNATTADTQWEPVIAPDPGSGFTVAWSSKGQDGSGLGVYARRFDSAGAPLSGEIAVNTTTANEQGNPVIAPDPGGGFTTVWQSYGQDGSGWGVYARRFDSAGAPLTGEIPVNATTASTQWEPVIAPDPGGGFTVAWSSQEQDGSDLGVYARRFDSAGAPLSGEIAVNTTTASRQFGAAIAADGNSGFTVTWTSLFQDGSDFGVYARRFVDAPDTRIDSGPAAGSVTNDASPTFSFSSNEQGSSFECRFESEPFSPCSGPGPSHTPAVPLSEGPHSFEVRASRDPTHTDPWPASRSFVVNILDTRGTGTTTLPPPIRGRTVIVEPVRGVVRIREGRSGRFRRLRSPRQIAVGSLVDASRGRVGLTSATRRGRTQSADFYRGAFRVSQPARGRPITELTLVKITRRGRRIATSSKARRGHRGRRRHRGSGLWGNGHGNYVTRGKHGSATVRGTIWFTADLPEGTFFKVRRGVVQVRDFTRHRGIKLRPGQHYLAPAR